MLNLKTRAFPAFFPKAVVKLNPSYLMAALKSARPAQKSFQNYCTAGILSLGLVSGSLLADAEFVYEGSGFEQDARIVVRNGKVMLTHSDKSLSLIHI